VDLGDLLLDPMRTSFAGHLEGRHRPLVPIVPAALGGGAGWSARQCWRTLVEWRVEITLPSFRRLRSRRWPSPGRPAAGVGRLRVRPPVPSDGRREPAACAGDVRAAGAIAADVAGRPRITGGPGNLRPAATLAHGFDTVARIAGPERLLATIGAGGTATAKRRTRASACRSAPWPTGRRVARRW
jgi:hypothetical protein